MMRITIKDIHKMKQEGLKIPMITAYDYTSANLVARADIPLILVGDSLGQVILGHDSTLPVTMDDMVRHTQMVVRATATQHIVSDMPFMSYQIDEVQALRNAGRLMKEGGCQSIKLEGGAIVAETIRRIVASGVPVMGHLGLTPQSVNQLGGYRVQGRDVESAARLIKDSLLVQEAGAYALVLELVPKELASEITRNLDIPTIGIGSGIGCSGQVQVFHDLLGLIENFSPKHSKKYMNLFEEIVNGIMNYKHEVEENKFPTTNESFSIDQDLLERAIKLLD